MIWLGVLGNETNIYNKSTEINETKLPIERADRTASGRKVKDVIATKNLVNITYGLMNNDELNTLESIYNLDDTLSLLIEREDASIDSYLVEMKPVSKTNTSRINGKWYWEGIALILEEI